VKNSDWDIDLRAGELGESKVADLLSLDTVEVKTDRRWKETGNLYIETECYYVADNSWKPSGVRVSKATHWAFVLEDSVLIIPLHILKEAVWHSKRPITCNIPPNPSRGYLITPAVMIEHAKQFYNRVEEDMVEHLAETWVDPAERIYPD
jgi:hypothetical protein